MADDVKARDTTRSVVLVVLLVLFVPAATFNSTGVSSGGEPRDAGLSIDVTAEPSDEVLPPGETVTYTLTVSNDSDTDYTKDDPAYVDVDLTKLLDDAEYNNDWEATVGDVIFVDPVLDWEGALDAGESATITYSVTIDDPLEGDGSMTSAVSGPPGSTCDDAGEPDDSCTTTVLVRALKIVKNAKPADGLTLGDTATYEVRVTNIGQVGYTADEPASFVDDLTGVLDDATYADDAEGAANSQDPGVGDPGTIEIDENTLTWTGPLEPGDRADVTYSVTINDTRTGDGFLVNAVAGPPESTCPTGIEPGCHTYMPLVERD